MPKEQKPGWEYYYSELLQEEYAVHIETGWVYWKNGARYSPEEVKLVVESGSLDIGTHRVKTIIKGEIVGYENGETKNEKPEDDELEIW